MPMWDIYILPMKGVKRVRVRKLQGTSYLLSEQVIASNAKGSICTAYNVDSPNEELVAKMLVLRKDESLEAVKGVLQKLVKLPHHENVVKYHQIKALNEETYCIIMEYCNEGDVGGRIAEMKLMPQQKIWVFLRQVAKGYRMLFDAGVVHLKMRPSNILISNGKYKLTDVEYKIRTYSSMDNEGEITKNEWSYMAPQVQQQKISPKLDVFSLGCMAYQFSYDGIHPFQDCIAKSSCPSDYFQRVTQTSITLKQKNNKGQKRSQSLRQLIHRMLHPVQKRISWAQIFQHPNIGVNIHPKETVTATSEKENEIDVLRKTLVNVNRSSIFIKEDESAQGSEERMTISFGRILDKNQLKYIEQTMLRLKIVLLSIIHCNHKINGVLRQNSRHKKLQGYIVQSIKKVAVEGLLYLLKNIQIATERINEYDKEATKELRGILHADRQRIIEQYKKQARVFKNVDEETFIHTLKSYDLRSFEHCLYSLLTVYCDYHKEGKEILRVVISILIDIYDTALRLTEMTQKEKISWKASDYEEIQTKMDTICLSPQHAHQLHSYLTSKQLVTEKEVNSSLRTVGLLFE